MKINISTGDKDLDSLLTDFTSPYLGIGTHSVSIVGDSCTKLPTADHIIMICDGDKVQNSASDAANVVFLRRPLSLAALKRALFEVPHIAEASVPARETFFYDKEVRLLSKDECSVTLTAKEAEIFELLLASRGTPVSRDTLNEAFPDKNGKSNAVDVYISYLRRKLSRIFGEGVLTSVRGFGYVLKI